VLELGDPEAEAEGEREALDDVEAEGLIDCEAEKGVSEIRDSF